MKSRSRDAYFNNLDKSLYLKELETLDKVKSQGDRIEKYSIYLPIKAHFQVKSHGIIGQCISKGDESKKENCILVIFWLLSLFISTFHSHSVSVFVTFAEVV